MIEEAVQSVETDISILPCAAIKSPDTVVSVSLKVEAPGSLPPPESLIGVEFTPSKEKATIDIPAPLAPASTKLTVIDLLAPAVGATR